MIRFFLCIAIAVISSCSYGQASGKEDSIKHAELQNGSELLRSLQQQHVIDSIRQQTILLQTQRKEAGSAHQKQALQHQIDSLKASDQNRINIKKHTIDSLRTYVSGFPVAFFKDTLFYLFTKNGLLNASERASIVSERIQALAKQASYDSTLLSLVKNEESVDIVYQTTVLLNISETEALWSESNPVVLAEIYKDRIAAGIQQYRESHNVITIATKIGLALLVIAGFVVIFLLLNKLFQWIKYRLQQKELIWFKGIDIRSYELFSPQKQLNVILSLINGIKWFVLLIVAYITLPILFSIFPLTESIATRLISYILNPVSIIFHTVLDYLPNLFTIIVIVTIFYYIITFISFLKNEVKNHRLIIAGFHAEWANSTYQIIRFLIIAFCIVVIFPYLPGSDSPVFKGTSVFIGFIVTFGSAGSLSNIMSGMMLTYMRLFRLGDRVKIGDVVGVIIEKNALVIRIRTIKNEIISIPNSTVMASHSTNYSVDAADKGLILHTSVTIGYDAPWKQVHALLIQAALKTSNIIQEPAPFVLQISLDDFYVNYEINAYTRESLLQDQIYSDLHQNIQDAFNEAGVEIMSPHYKAYRDGNAVTIPEEYSKNKPKE